MISYLTLHNELDFVELFDANELESVKSSVNFQSLLALYLLHERSKGEESRWVSYIKTLPESFTVPYFCKKPELFCLPETLLEKVVEQNETVKKNFQELMRIVSSEEREKFSLEDFKWAYFVCNSRSVFLKGKSLESLVDELHFKELLSDSPNMALAPLLDLLNHSDEAMTKSQLTHSEQFIEQNHQKIKSRDVQLSYQLFTLKPVKKHSQIFINYGTFNNTKLLLEYGFIIPNNQFDFLEFSLADVNNYIKNHPQLCTLQIPKHKYKFIRDHKLDQQMYIDVNDGLNHNFQAVIAILLVPQNIYNLTQVAFGDELNFNDIRHHAMEIVRRKKIDLREMCDNLEKQSELSGSGGACCEYFTESVKLIDKVLDFHGSL
jgi:ATP-binding cassette subfamily B (MDR/TAP) protein 7